MGILIRIRKRTRKTLAWLRGWFHANVTLRRLCRTGTPIRDLSLFARRIPFIERREYSQNGEDGMIAAIFAKIGTTNRYCVEFGVEDGLQCNCRYLLKHKGWTGLLMDGGDWTSGDQQNNKQLSSPLSHYLSSIPPPLPPGEEGELPKVRPSSSGGGIEGGGEEGRGRGWYTGTLTVHQEFVTAENIELLFRKYGVPPSFDLLSIDIDGNDYWVWKAITHFRPRVVIIEYNANKGADASVTIPYDAGFLWDKTDYQGASLRALKKLGEEKGYVLVGTDPCGVNAFFVLQNLVPGNFDPPEFAQIFHPAAYKGIPGKGHPADPKGRAWVTV